MSFSRLLRYDDWANREVLGVLRSGEPPAQAVAWYAHVIAAEWLWLARLTDSPARHEVWPSLTLDECARELDELHGAWAAFLDELTDERRASRIEYVNSKGESHASVVDDVLTHVVMHSAYHRGQIASALRVAGIVPAYTDFIHAARQGYVP